MQKKKKPEDLKKHSKIHNSVAEGRGTPRQKSWWAWIAGGKKKEAGTARAGKGVVFRTKLSNSDRKPEDK